MLEDKAQPLKDKVFAYYKDETLTYEELNDKANRIANSLIKEMGVKKGDRVAVMFSNCMDYILLQFGIAKSGGLQVPINIEAKGDLLAHFLNNSNPEVLIIGQKFLPLVKEVEHLLAKVPKILVFSSGVSGEQISFEKKIEKIPFEELFIGSSDPPPVRLKRTDPIDIFYPQVLRVLPRAWYCHTTITMFFQWILWSTGGWDLMISFTPAYRITTEQHNIWSLYPL
ncbi:MAG: class I adenylate-forming enzyme family protein [Pseudomonadota bacterium]